MKNQNYINHIALVLDASGSMNSIASQTAQVADQQIAYLAQRSKELDQETRVSVYTFNDFIDCLIYDKDVLRMPSIKGLYQTGGQTALIDATMKALQDLAKTPELYGEHSFLTYVLTDGGENASRAFRAEHLKNHLKGLKEHWTLACFVPNAIGVSEAKRFGFEKENIAVWDATARGIEEAGRVMRQATEGYMQMRATGVRGTRSLFNLDAANLTKVKVTKGVEKRHPGQYRTLLVSQKEAIAPFVENFTRVPYKLGQAFYELTKPEKIQAQREIAILENRTYTLFTGPGTRGVLGLPDYEVKVNPASHPQYTIFVQSTSVNRNLVPGTRVLVL